MNEEEAELLPPYLRPYPPSGAPLGTLSYNRRSKCWVVKGDPSVTEVCKRLFPGSAGSRRGEARFTAHRRAGSCAQAWSITLPDEPRIPARP